MLSGMAMTVVSGSVTGSAQQPDKASGMQANESPLVVSTWPFGREANRRALSTLSEGGSIIDAVERGIKVAEADLSNSSVGQGGLPNADGVVQLDACIMVGQGHRAGSVMALEGIGHPISVARCVMEHSPHVVFAGEGARQFALKHGFTEMDLLTETSRKAWEGWAQKNRPEPPQGSIDNHDTIALLVLGKDGELAGGCSTSGMAFKSPGRVGDSPIIGGGLYVDNQVGAAGATGIGENVLRYCGSFLVVENMRRGMDPSTACMEAVKRIAKRDPRRMEDLHIHFIALDKKGRFGAAGSTSGFTMAVNTPQIEEFIAGKAMSGGAIGAEGGHIPPEK